ncbi:MAG: sortase [Candidatus Paceibacterota bacterium]
MTATIPRTGKTTVPFWQNRYLYAYTVAGMMAILYLLFYFLGLVPVDFRYEPSTPSRRNTPAVSAQSTTTIDNLSPAVPQNEQASHITIDKIGVDTPIMNPVSTNIQTLNNYLSEGAVRYPTSGTPGDGNLFLFGHSSGLSNIINQAYKAFNNIGELEKGDTIKVETFSGTYYYSVIDVELHKDAEIFVPFDTGKDMLTLSTCNNFGAKEDRFVVRAKFTNYVPYVQ